MSTLFSMEETKLSTEMISFQKDDFTTSFEKILYDIVDHLKEFPGTNSQDLNRLSFRREMAKLIYDRFKINLEIDFNTGALACVYTLPVSGYNVLNNYRGYESDRQVKVTQHFINKTGTVDLNKAVLGGIFSEYRHKLMVDIIPLMKTVGLTIPELTAVVLHELGHIFTWYEYSDRLESVNQALKEISNTFKNNDKTKRIYLYKELATRLGKSEKTFDDISDSDKRIIVGKRLYEEVFDSFKSQMPNSKYDETSSEYLADNFASRFGYGRHLISGLHKIHKVFASPEVNAVERALSNIVQCVFIMASCLTTIGAIMGAFALLAPAAFYTSISLLWLYFGGDADKDMTYDDLKVRYKRIRTQHIEAIKKLDLSKDELNDLIAEVTLIDEFINKATVYRGPFATLSNFLFSKNRRAIDDITLQQTLEDLMHNDLFLSAAKLKTI